MKISNRVKWVALILFFAWFSEHAIAQLQQDSKYGFKINIPTDWSKKVYMDGTDKVWDFYSPDQNAAIQLRAFEATDSRITIDLMAQIYEQTMLPAGSQKQSLVDHTTVNGIPGKQGLYSFDYNGNQVNLAAFYTLQNEKAYILTAIIPTSMIEAKGDEIKAITHSFLIDGFESQAVVSAQNTSGLMGGLSQKLSKMGSQNSTSNSGSVVGKYNFVSRSDGKDLLIYWYIDIKADGTYKDEHQLRSQGNYIGGNEGTWKIDGNTLTLKHRSSTVTDTYTWHKNELSRESSGGIKFLFRK